MSQKLKQSNTQLENDIEKLKEDLNIQRARRLQQEETVSLPLDFFLITFSCVLMFMRWHVSAIVIIFRFPLCSHISFFFFFWVVVLCAILQIADMQETLKTVEEETSDLKSQTEQVKYDADTCPH